MPFQLVYVTWDSSNTTVDRLICIKAKLACTHAKLWPEQVRLTCIINVKIKIGQKTKLIIKMKWPNTMQLK